MAYHPNKCNVNRNRNSIKFNHTLHGHPFDSQEEVKYLGLTIRQDLKCNFLGRNLLSVRPT